MATKPTEEFKREAVRIALTSGLPRKHVAADLGIGLSTLGKWIKRFEADKVVPDADRELALENERLRREIKILRDERDILKKATAFFASQK